jgi:hypothetical protein
MAQLLSLNNARIRGYLGTMGYEPEPGVLHLLGVRGAVPVAPTVLDLRPDSLDQYNDSVGTFGTALRMFRATVDPGLYYTRNPSNPQGAAHLIDGRWAYRRGLHKKRPALVQAAAVTVRRDRDRDGTAEPGEPLDSGWFGINIHQGGAVNRPVGSWSAGCQVVVREDWPAFWRLVERSGQQSYQYYLVTGTKFARWLESQPVAARGEALAAQQQEGGA